MNPTPPAAGPGKLKVVFLTRSLLMAGAERQLTALVTHMDKRRFHPLVLSYYPGDFDAVVRSAGVEVISLGKTGTWDVWKFFARLYKEIKRNHPHILHGYLETSNVISTFLKIFFPGMKVVYGVRSSDMDLSKYGRLVRLSFRLEIILSRFADLIILNSEYARVNWIKRGFPAEKCLVIPNGIDVNHFAPPAAPAQGRREIDLPAEAVVVGTVGRMDPVKGLETYLEAIQVLSVRNPDVYFLIVGSGPENYKSDLISLVERLGIGERVIWLEAQQDILSIYHALDIFCLPSNSESFSNVLAEAMACGLACVSTDVGDAAAILGDASYVVPRRDPQALAAALQRMLDLPPQERQALGQRARARIVENYSVERMAARTQDALEGLLKQKK